jgi:hypothetical protein
VPDAATCRIRYTGPVPFASLVAQTLREEGLEVSWTRPDVEERGLGEVLDGVAVVYIVKGVDAVIRAAVAKARERLGKMDRPGKLEIEDDEDEDE